MWSDLAKLLYKTSFSVVNCCLLGNILLTILPCITIIINNNNVFEIDNKALQRMKKRVDLIIHPVRFRILQTLAKAQLTTQEIAERLPDVPKSSIYRHLKLLLENEVVAVVETQLVKGIEEKTYRVAQSLRLSAAEMDGLSAEEHLGYFTNYTLTLLKEFDNYLQDAEAADGKIDMLADRVGYSEVTFYATKEELNQIAAALNQAIVPLLNNEAGNGRSLHKFATITHPIRTPKRKKL